MAWMGCGGVRGYGAPGDQTNRIGIGHGRETVGNGWEAAQPQNFHQGCFAPAAAVICQVAALPWVPAGKILRWTSAAA
jgi:hypothetical protein